MPTSEQPGEMTPTLAFVGHINSVNSLAFSSNGNTLLSCSYDQTIIVWDVPSGQMKRRLLTNDLVHAVVFSNDRIAIDSGGHVWDVVTGELRHKYRGTNDLLALSPDGATLAFLATKPRSKDCIVRLTDVRTGKPQGTFACGDIAPENLAFSADGQVVAVAGPSNQDSDIWVVTLWYRQEQSLTTREFQEPVQLFGVALPVWTRLVAVSSRAASIWDAETGDLVQTWRDQFWEPAYGNRPDLLERGMTLSGDGRLLAVGYYDGMVTIRDVTTREINWKLKAHEGGVRSLAFTRDNRILATAGDDNVVHLWDIASRAQKITLPGSQGSVTRLAFDKSEPLLMAAGEDGLLRYWNLHSGALQQSIRGNIDNAGQEENIASALTPDGKTRATAGIYGAGGVQLWDVESGRQMRTIRTMDDPLALAFSQDGAMLAIGTGYNEHILLVPVISRLRGRRLTGYTNLRCWPPASLRKTGGVYWLKGHTNSLRCLAYSPDGRWLASGAADNTVRLWSTTDNRLCLTLCALPDNEWIAYTPDGYYNASPGADRFLRWQIGNELLPLEAYAARFRQPERIQSVLQRLHPLLPLS